MGNSDTYRAVIKVNSQAVETAIYALDELGSLGAIEESTGDECLIRLTAFFSADKFKKSELRDLILDSFAHFSELGGACVEISIEPASDWNAKWREHFKPFALAEGVVIAPSWEKYEKKSDEIVIQLDPGMAFGTGLHETTRLCAEGLLGAISYRPLAHLSLLDVGTGSGILSILASKLGVKNITSVDNDPDALKIARKNMETNGCLSIRLLDQLDEVDGEFEIVVANILLTTLVDMRGALTSHVPPGGLLLVSGITLDQEQVISDAYSAAFDKVDTQRKGEWSCLSFLRKE